VISLLFTRGSDDQMIKKDFQIAVAYCAIILNLALLGFGYQFKSIEIQILSVLNILLIGTPILYRALTEK